MTRTQFIRKFRELGYTDYFIGGVLELRHHEKTQGIKRRYIDYIPDFIKRIKTKRIYQ